MEGSCRKPSAEEVVEGVVDNIFRKYDQNNNAHIDYPEFCQLIADLKLSVKISPKEVSHIFAVLDVNRDGMVSRRELADAFLAVKSSIL